MRYPDFVIIGAQKSGTTWLRKHLRTHPDVFMPGRELHYFDRPEVYANGPAWYGGQFAEARETQVVGEKTPDYLYLPCRADIPEGAGRLHALLPDARLIVTLRDPVPRALSTLVHLARTGRLSPLPSADALLCGGKQDLLPWPVIDMGRYHRQLAAYLDLYDRDDVLVLLLEDDIAARPAATLDRIADFLNLRRDGFSRDRLSERVNTSHPSRLSLAVKYYLPVLYQPTLRLTWRFPAYDPRLSESARRELYRLYEPDNERLFELLGRRPTTGWRFNPDSRHA